MSPTLIFAMASILLAASIYTMAVFSERAAGVLKPWHLALFWAGLVFDTIGTSLMAEIAGGWRFDLHGVVGMSAIALMLIHSVWASIALGFKQQRVLHTFHRFSIMVWGLWTFALVSGFAMVIFGWE
ncbi:MAG: HsmA family protein [Actinomycetes bacterium]